MQQYWDWSRHFSLKMWGKNMPTLCVGVALVGLPQTTPLIYVAMKPSASVFVHLKMIIHNNTKQAQPNNIYTQHFNLFVSLPISYRQHASVRCSFCSSMFCVDSWKIKSRLNSQKERERRNARVIQTRSDRFENEEEGHLWRGGKAAINFIVRKIHTSRRN